MPTWGELLSGVHNYDSAYDYYRHSYLELLNDREDRDALLYSSGWTHSGVNSPRQSITDVDMQGIMEAFSGLDGNELDLILHTPGGSPDATESIVDYIRSKYDHVRMFIPHAAMSAGSMMCCAADELIMGRHSFLGPIDPQIALDTATGYRAVPAAAIINQFEQAQEEIDDNQDNLAHWTPILRQYGPGLIQECEQAIELSKELAEEWAGEYLLEDEDEAEELASNLTDWDEFKSHNRHLHRNKARDEGFEVSDLEEDDKLQDIILTIYHATTMTHDHKGVAKIIETHEGNSFIVGGGRSSNRGQGNQMQINSPRLPSSRPKMPPGGPSQSEE